MNQKWASVMERSSRNFEGPKDLLFWWNQETCELLNQASERWKQNGEIKYLTTFPLFRQDLK
jgi:hypothetical protein